MGRKAQSRIVGKLVAAVFIVATVSAYSLGVLQPASAACALPATNYGSATMKLAVDTAGTYRVWTHLYSPDATNNAVLLDIDGGTCFTVGNSNTTAGGWTWVNHQNGTFTSKVTATLTAGNHTITLVGNEPGVKVDRVLAVLDQNCTPTGNGDNCMATSDTQKPAVTITQPASGSTVSGSTTISANATDNVGVSKVEFYVDNQLVLSDTSAPYSYSWDVSGLANNTYTVTVKAYDATGNNASDSQAVVVKNGDTQAPTAPTAVTATVISANNVALAWKPSTDNIGVTAYRIVRDGTTIATVATTAYNDTTTIAGTKYTYAVIAVDASNNASAASDQVVAITPAPTTVDTQAPTQPQDMTASAVSSSQINIAWKASVDNVGIKSYDIYRTPSGGQPSKVASITATSYGDGGLDANTQYSYYVIAKDAANNSSQQSGTVSATTLQPATQQGKSTLRGTIQGRNGRPISGAKVTIWVNDKRYQAVTNWRGRYILTDIPSGRYDVSYKAHGYTSFSETVRLFPGKTRWEDVTLRQ
jgi:fibronectin type 3 domain-containing protein